MPIDSFVRVPPDSTGKRLFTQEHTVGAVAVQAQVMHLADEDNPNYMVAVDESGALYTRFAEGKPQLDSFGKLRLCQPSRLAQGRDALPKFLLKHGLGIPQGNADDNGAKLRVWRCLYARLPDNGRARMALRRHGEVRWQRN